jgi:membrane fusion protein (multidrug efflux system)
MSANVTAVLSQRDSALTIPSEAIFAEGNQMLVYVINGDGTVAKTPIKLGSRSSASAEVLAGLTAGQQVVKAGHQKLFPGAKVMTGPPPESAGQPSSSEGGDQSGAMPDSDTMSASK